MERTRTKGRTDAVQEQTTITIHSPLIVARQDIGKWRKAILQMKSLLGNRPLLCEETSLYLCCRKAFWKAFGVLETPAISTIHPQEQITVSTRHRLVSARQLQGSVRHYCQKQIIAQAKWQISLSDDEAVLSVVGSPALCAAIIAQVDGCLA